MRTVRLGWRCPCLNDGFAQADCVWSAAQTGISLATWGVGNMIRGWGQESGPIMRFVYGFLARSTDFVGGLANTGISLQRTGWYDEEC